MFGGQTIDRIDNKMHSRNDEFENIMNDLTTLQFNDTWHMLQTGCFLVQGMCFCMPIILFVYSRSLPPLPNFLHSLTQKSTVKYIFSDSLQANVFPRNQFFQCYARIPLSSLQLKHSDRISFIIFMFTQQVIKFRFVCTFAVVFELQNELEFE